MSELPPLNGHGPQLGPLSLSPAERHAILAQLNMHHGWLLLTRAEFIEMRQAMAGLAHQNKRLERQLSNMDALRKATKKATGDADRLRRELATIRAREEMVKLSKLPPSQPMTPQPLPNERPKP